MVDLTPEISPLHLKPGKHNMASAAFAELRAARRDSSEPEGTGITFGDLLDSVNPLQHIPVVSQAYRHLTGDGIDPEARVAGSLLYGGPIGAIASIFSLAVSDNGDEGIGDRILASIVGTPSTGSPPSPMANSGGEPREERVASHPAASSSPSPLARAASAGAPALPRLSSDAFQALIGSFADPGALQEARAGVSTEDGVSDERDPAPLADAGLMSAMQQAMDKYDSLKKQSAGQP
jgi:hypothetical protein